MARFSKVPLRLNTAAVVVLGVSSGAAAEANQQTVKQVSEPSWTDCVVSEATPTVRFVKCPDVELRFMRTPQVQGEHGIRTFLANLGVSAEIKTLKVGDKRVPFADAPNLKAPMLMAAPNHTFMVACYPSATPLTAPCLPRVAWMGAHGLPPGVTFPQPNMKFADVTLKVPQGCTLKGAERIVCPTGSLDFREGKLEKDALDMMTNFFVAAGLRITAAQDHPCSLGKHRGQGRILNISVQNASTTIMVCTADDAGRTFTAQCIGTDPRTHPKYPEPCDQVFR